MNEFILQISGMVLLYNDFTIQAGLLDRLGMISFTLNKIVLQMHNKQVGRLPYYGKVLRITTLTRTVNGGNSEV